MTEHLHTHGPDGTPQVIAWFDDFDQPHEYRALSNFYIGEPLEIMRFGDDKPFMTGEHAYAAMKTWGIRGNRHYYRICDAPSPQKAKTLGRTLPIREDWEEVKYDVMMAVLRAKFTTSRLEGDILLATGDALLIEGTYWDDTVWGVALDSEDDPLMAPGRNWLGTMLMARRAELKAEVYFGHTNNSGAYNATFSTGK